MAIKLIFVLKLICAFLIAYSSQAEIKYAQFGKAGDTNVVKNFPFGSKVGIYCVQQTADSSSKTDIAIYDNGFINIVEDTVLEDGFSETYQFKVINSTTSLFIISNLTRQLNDTTFSCQSDQLLLVTIMGFNPINDVNPICTSSYPSRFIFEDSVQSDIEMNCTSEEGDPPVMLSTYIKDGDKTTNVTSISTRTVTSYPHPSKTLSFSSYFNSSFNNSVFICNVSQQLPAPYQSYQGSCTFGPILFLPLFSVTATPSNINFSDVRNEIFRCTSNVSEVRLSWTKLPTHWKYDIKDNDASIELIVSDTGRGVYSGDIQCNGYLGDRNITSMIEIRATNSGTDVPYGDTNNTSKMDNNEINDPGRVKTVALVITAISLCLIFVLIVIVVLYFRLNVSFCNRNPDLAKQNSSTNNANDRNTTITDDVVSSMRFQTENSALDVPAMIDNTIYEAYTEKDCQNQTLSETERLEKEQEIEMVENEIYESNSFSGYG